MKDHKESILVIVGPTSSGKSDLAVELALRFNGEVISADSRQVYRGLDIGTGKITPGEMKGVPHRLLDVADPKERFTVNDWKLAAEAAIADIASRGKLPIVCGGTGYYIDALVYGLEFPEIEGDPDEQQRLEGMPLAELAAELLKLDPRRAAALEKNGGIVNPRRLARAIMIARELGAVPEMDPAHARARYDATWIGIRPPDKDLRDRIRARLIRRLDGGMVDEAKLLHEQGLSYERMEELGLEYRYLARFLEGALTQAELVETLAMRIWQYARRQKTWWRRNPNIVWFDSAILGAIEASVRQSIGQG